jgi:group I intron endonuclease
MNGVVYKIKNIISGKTYIGLTTLPIHDRFKQHLYTARGRKRSGHKLSYLHNAMIKYGESSFEIEVVASAVSASFLGELEKILIVQERPEYNQTGGGEVTNGRKLTRSSREKISRANKGRKRDAEFKRRLSERFKKDLLENPELKGELLKKLNANKSDWEARRVESVRRVASSRTRTRDEIEKSASSRRKAVFCHQTQMTYPSRVEASVGTGVSERSIRRVCQGKIGSVRGHTFSYVGK